MLTVERLKEVLDYNPTTGLFHWRVSPSYNIYHGKQAGCLDKSTGYIVIRIDRVKYGAHRLAWLYTHGKFPSVKTDHINGIRNDNRIENLREATDSLNSQNRRGAQSNNKLGLLGVSAFGKKFQAQISLNGKNLSIGIFDTKEEAYESYLMMRRKHYEGNTL